MSLDVPPDVSMGPKLPHKARILLACGLHGKTLLLATDSAWVEHEADAIANDAADIGIDLPEDTGLWLWDGTLKAVDQYGEFGGPGEVETEYTGTLRRVTDQAELNDLLAMSPPPTCWICGKPATTEYPPDARDEGETAPSCGSPACEIQMQAGMDYHAEAGDR